MIEPTHVQIPVTESSQPSAARFAARHAAEGAGFSAEESHRAGLVATELATNLLKHAQNGELLVRVVSPPPDGEIELLAIDRGPGIADLQRALVDGHSTSGSPGTGLGAVQRLSEDFDIHSTLGRGTVVLARLRSRRLRDAARGAFRIGAVSVPIAGEHFCGDTWSIQDRRDSLLALVADGLGHGPLAADAARAVSTVFVSQSSWTPAGALGSAHAAVRHTRGAAAAVAEIRPREGVIRFAGVGNVAASIVTNGTIRHAVSHNGTLGHEARYFREYTYPWNADSLLVMHSDGLTRHWSLDAYPGIGRQHPTIAAAVLYRDSRRQRDDVAVLVAQEAR
jgi:anti-sigma regulatory factor (Ser/Thr protein kinase)